MRTETPVQIKLSDYQPYPFAMDEVELTFELAPSATKVHAKIAVRKLAESPLKLDGVALQLDEVRLNGAKLEPGAYELTDESLTLKDLPDTFTLPIPFCFRTARRARPVIWAMVATLQNGMTRI